MDETERGERAFQVEGKVVRGRELNLKRHILRQ